MPAIRRARPSRKTEDDESLKRSAPEAEDVLGQESDGVATPAVPNLNGGPLEPEAWLSLQQAIGNSAVGGLVERRRAGQSLPADARHDMEVSFGRSFGQVQVRSGPEVDQAAQALEAVAFTAGDDIYVHSALPGFDDPFGKQVLGEELAHVAQGVGTRGVGRVTDPGETAERQAHAAGRSAAAGQKAEVSVAPEAAGAVGRFDLSNVITTAEAAIGDAMAAGMPKTELSDEEKDRLKAGALDPLFVLFDQLNSKLDASKDGKLPAQTLQPITANSAGIGKLIYSFDGIPAVQPAIEEAAISAEAGRDSLFAAMDPKQAVSATAEALSSAAAAINGLASAPAPGSVPDPTGAAASDTLTSPEAEQLKLGAGDPLSAASQELKTQDHDLGLIIERLRSIPAFLRSFSKPAPVVAQLHRWAMNVEVHIRTLEAAHGGAKDAIIRARVEWSRAIRLLQGLTAKSAAGGATAKSEPPASGDDDGSKKPN